jgi:superfamily II DNA or RNA helicase
MPKASRAPRAPRSSKTRVRTSVRATAEPKLSPQRKPHDLDAAEWQRLLRRQFGRAETFRFENIGTAPVFSEFIVTNPKTKGRYRVAIRGRTPGDNYCACPDFATNDLGTCKHVEFVLSQLERRRGGARALADGFVPTYSEIFVRYGPEREVRFRAGSTCPPTLARRAQSLFADGRLDPTRYDALTDFSARAEAAGHELRCYADVWDLVARSRDAQHRRETLDALYPQGAMTPALTDLVRTRLYPYQVEGALFAARAGRCLIGDDMGLGKTVQAIAATELFARHFGAERVLIVCPTSLQHQWQRELDRFTGRTGTVMSGTRRMRSELWSGPGFCKITNYNKLAADLSSIQAWAPDVVIVDEAQRIKNWNTVAAKALKRIESPYAIVLTGTPLENRLEELVSIVQFVDRYRLGPTWRLRHDHQIVDDTGRVTGYRDLNRLGETLRPVLLRRRKSEVLTQLPERVDNTVFVDLSVQQRDIHQVNATAVQQIVTRWRRTGYLSDIDQRRLMSALQNMRMACNSTYLFDRKTEDGEKFDEITTLLAELFERPDAKAVVFSQWVGTHELLSRRLSKHGWDHVVFHGGIPSAKRGALIDRFHEDPSCRVFLSTDAGGVGLNLQHAAATVINMDLPWNPAVLEQRIGRVHRLGQTRGVQVVNFVARDTIEESMLSVLAFKQSLAAGVLDQGDSDVFLDGTRLGAFMKRVEAVTGLAESPLTAATEMPPKVEAAVRTAATIPAATSPNPWQPIIAAGLQLLQSLAANGAGAVAVEADAATGRHYLKVPMPNPDTLAALTGALTQLAQTLGGEKS